MWLYEMLGDLKKGRHSLLDVLKRAKEEVNEAAGELLRVQALVSKEHARSLKAQKELEQITGPFKASQLKGKVDKAMEKMEWPSDETDSSDDPDIVARRELDTIKKKKEEARKKKKTDSKRKRDHKDRSPPPNGKGREGDDEGRRNDDDGDCSDQEKDQRPKPLKRARRNGQDQNGTSAHPVASTAKLLEARDSSIPFIGSSQKRSREDDEDSATSEGEVERTCSNKGISKIVWASYLLQPWKSGINVHCKRPSWHWLERSVMRSHVSGQGGRSIPESYIPLKS
ncbi:uncharacterized protein LACBIDRAFT_329147 [Laccaria bicolor S238N-H82]|uniref:Predicted protein n=1 Tax=Laccaria bicolor (strain S238N-H82 / ATCC MYA-4686) TaxID=486041 RepID=B0DH77_LACBS|nr:uncharacterized protein LACBIDRAFT_329147 [Laccaria bicolor S238N-H82]EDR05967.1 predicted protein [Laccaria bicolor S238N-H82]|eukprot:XP_001883255.1 predicted protein [Laccaria bicolor S238N-H82]